MKYIAVVASLFLCACSSQIHEKYRDSERVSIYKSTCETPYPLTIGCHPEGKKKNSRRLVGATIPLAINSAKVRYSAAADGKVIYIGIGQALDIGLSFVKGHSFGAADPKGNNLKATIDGLVELLNDNGAALVKIVPVMNFTEVAGYYIVSDINMVKLISKP